MKRRIGGIVVLSAVMLLAGGAWGGADKPPAPIGDNKNAADDKALSTTQEGQPSKSGTPGKKAVVKDTPNQVRKAPPIKEKVLPPTKAKLVGTQGVSEGAPAADNTKRPSEPRTK